LPGKFSPSKFIKFYKIKILSPRQFLEVAKVRLKLKIFRPGKMNFLKKFSSTGYFQKVKAFLEKVSLSRGCPLPPGFWAKIAWRRVKTRSHLKHFLPLILRKIYWDAQMKVLICFLSTLWEFGYCLQISWCASWSHTSGGGKGQSHTSPKISKFFKIWPLPRRKIFRFFYRPKILEEAQ